MLRPRDLVCRHTPGEVAHPSETLAFRQKCLTALECLFGARHIGYVVVPELRRRGYATAILRRSLEIAYRSLGIAPVLLTCDDDNVASIRTIEKNGGVLENVVTGPDLVKPKRSYWIDARTEAGRVHSSML